MTIINYYVDNNILKQRLEQIQKECTQKLQNQISCKQSIIHYIDRLQYLVELVYVSDD